MKTVTGSHTHSLAPSRTLTHTHPHTNGSDNNDNDLTMAAALKSALHSKDPKKVAEALAVPNVSPTSKGGQLRAHHEKLTVGNHDWSQVVSSLLDVRDAAAQGDAEKCYDAQSTLHSAFNHHFASYSGNWLVFGLHMVCKNTYKIASVCATQKDQSKMQNAVNLLQESFSRCLNDRKEFQVRIHRRDRRLTMSG